MITVVEGTLYQSTVTFTDDAGNPVTPTTVAFVYAPNGMPTGKVTLTYASAVTPAPGVVAKTGTNVYVAQIDTTGMAGTIEGYWQSTGVGQATSETDTVVVTPVPF